MLGWDRARAVGRLLRLGAGWEEAGEPIAGMLVAGEVGGTLACALVYLLTRSALGPTDDW